MSELHQKPDPDHVGETRCPLCGADLRPTAKDRELGLHSRRVAIMVQDHHKLWLCPDCRGTWERRLWD